MSEASAEPIAAREPASLSQGTQARESSVPSLGKILVVSFGTAPRQ